MSDIAIDTAVWSGFRLAGRRPLAFLLWTLVYVVLGLGPAVLIFALIGPDYIGVFQSAISAGGEPDIERLSALTAQIQAVQGLSLLASLVLYAVLYAAIFRAVLEPENKRFGYLRLGADELRQGLLIAIFYIGFVLVMIVAVFAVVLLVGAAALASPTAGAVLGFAAFFAIAGGTIWLLARLSMVLPMTFAEKKLQFGKAWALTAGHGGRLFLIALLLVLIMVGMSLVLLIIVAATAGALVASLGEAAAITEYFSRPAEALFRDLSPWAVVVGLVTSVVSTLFIVVLAAPWAVVYRQLAGDRQSTADVFA